MLAEGLEWGLKPIYQRGGPGCLMLAITLAFEPHKNPI